MADLSQTAADVRPGSDAQLKLVQAGTDGITAGMPVYEDSSSVYQKSDANDSDAADCDGIALTNADEDEYFILQEKGTINLGATTVQGEVYVVSSTAGAIAPASDLASGWYPIILGFATDTSGNIDLDISVGSAAKT